jgi:hypothetical protein
MEQNGISISPKEMLQAYRTITRIMKENDMTMDTSFRRVQSWLSNAVCDSLKEENITEN